MQLPRLQLFSATAVCALLLPLGGISASATESGPDIHPPTGGTGTTEEAPDDAQKLAELAADPSLAPLEAPSEISIDYAQERANIPARAPGESDETYQLRFPDYSRYGKISDGRTVRYSIGKIRGGVRVYGSADWHSWMSFTKDHFELTNHQVHGIWLGSSPFYADQVRAKSTYQARGISLSVGVSVPAGVSVSGSSSAETAVLDPGPAYRTWASHVYARGGIHFSAAVLTRISYTPSCAVLINGNWLLA